MMDYSVVIPVFNSADTLPTLYDRLKKTFEKLPDVSSEFIFVDDGSQDRSWTVLKKLKERDPNQLKIIRLGKNFGQHNATFCGYNYSSGDYIITLDDDLQNKPEDIPKLIEEIKTTDLSLVYGVGERQHSAIRKMGSTLYRQGAKSFEKALGEGSSFRIITKELRDKILTHRVYFVYIDELLFWYTNYIGFVTVEHQARARGKSGYNSQKLYQMVKKNTLLYGAWPLKLMTWIGGVFSVSTFLLGVYFIAKKFVFGIAVAGYTSLVVIILFATSLILLCFGILGNYLVNINLLLTRKPTYSVKEQR